MIPAPFDYHRATTVDDAVELLDRFGGEARVLAGGQSLLPMMKLRLATPDVLVDIGRISGLRSVRAEDGHLVIGALTRHHDIEVDPLIRSHCPILADVAGRVGDPQVRHRGTFGGTIAHGDPAGDLPAVALALDATVVVAGPGGRREIAAANLYAGYYETTIAPGEIIVEVRVPFTDGPGSYQKFATRAQDWATVGVAAVRTAGTVRVALVNMGPTTLRARSVERAVASGATATEAATLAAEGTSPVGDLHASAEFREHLSTVLTERALRVVLG